MSARQYSSPSDSARASARCCASSASSRRPCDLARRGAQRQAADEAFQLNGAVQHPPVEVRSGQQVREAGLREAGGQQRRIPGALGIRQCLPGRSDGTCLVAARHPDFVEIEVNLGGARRVVACLGQGLLQQRRGRREVVLL
jgi:hypothetical protein